MSITGGIDKRESRHSFAGSGVTDGSGNVTFNFVPPFSVVPDVAVGVQSGSTNTTEARITALTAAACTINLRGSAVLVVLGINVLGAPVPQAGATVHIVAQQPGRIVP